MTNYCTLCPDRMFGFDFSKACKWHDHHYRLERKRYTREYVDKRFYEGLLMEVRWKCNAPNAKGHKPILNWLGHKLAQLMYWAVRNLWWAKASWKRWEYRWILGGLIIIKRKEFK